MKINRIILTNFRQYYGRNVIELPVQHKKNIILIGGRNGYGKTNLLLSLVWCLYGEDISKIDENFKKEIRKEGNYSKFLKRSLNWSAAKESKNAFSVEIEVEGVDLLQSSDEDIHDRNTCRIIRRFNIDKTDDELDIYINGLKNPDFTSEEDKTQFINECLVPVEAAKFFFFDPEKIASWAELSTREEGSVLNDAVGKILGLDAYESLINEFRIFIDEEMKNSATAGVLRSIESSETGITVNSKGIEELELAIQKKEDQMMELKDSIAQCETFLMRHNKSMYNEASLEELYKQKKEVAAKLNQREDRFNELSKLIPLAIVAGKLEEVISHLKKQDRYADLQERRDELSEKSDDFVEKLFNKHPFPDKADISFTNKMFYAEKARKLIDEMLTGAEETSEPNFVHDLSKADRVLITKTFELVGRQSKEVFEQTIEGYNASRNELTDIENDIRRIESDLQDEEVIRYTNKKKESERKIEKLIEEKVLLLAEKSRLQQDIETLKKSVQIDLKKISLSEKKRKRIDKAREYIDSLLEFVETQKKSKCRLIEEAIFNEMKKLMHKLQAPGKDDFIASVKVDILPDNEGLKVLLFDHEGNIRQKESLSQGEKQIYISSLIKAILALSVQEFPIFIDSPLGRLDDDHIRQVLLHYYPGLANQIILMATNNEIPPSRLKLIRDVISQSYLMENIDNKTTFKPGYFKSYEN